jgi:hypothetical protein
MGRLELGSVLRGNRTPVLRRLEYLDGGQFERPLIVFQSPDIPIGIEVWTGA